MIKRVKASIKREIILQQILFNLNQIDQWAEIDSWSRAAHYAAKTEALIELLEADDCGSHGGFDTERGQSEQPRGLRARYEWLRKLYW